MSENKINFLTGVGQTQSTATYHIDNNKRSDQKDQKSNQTTNIDTSYQLNAQSFSVFESGTGK